MLGSSNSSPTNTTYIGRMNRVNIDVNNGLLPVRRQTNIYANGDVSSIQPQRSDNNETLLEINYFPLIILHPYSRTAILPAWAHFDNYASCEQTSTLCN